MEMIEPATPPAKHTVTVGQLTLDRNPPLLTCGNWVIQLAPPSTVLMRRPPSPTATQTVELAQLIRLTPAAWACWLQVEPPLALMRIGPSSPAAQQMLAVEQLIARRELPLGLGFCQLQVRPVVRLAGVTEAGAGDRSCAPTAAWRDDVYANEGWAEAT